MSKYRCRLAVREQRHVALPIALVVNVTMLARHRGGIEECRDLVRDAERHARPVQVEVAIRGQLGDQPSFAQRHPSVDAVGAEEPLAGQ